MTVVLQELIQLREYNVKLRNALGEKVVATDSGVAVVGSPWVEKGDATRKESKSQKPAELAKVDMEQSMVGSSTLQPVLQENRRVVFPVVLPTEGYLTRGFDPVQRHFGLDIAGNSGSPVHAAADGYVVFAGWTNEDGNEVIVSHPGGFLTFYKHNQSLLTAMNAYVRRGEPIALLGSSGETSAGPHVHFEIWKDGVPVDPANFILNLNF